MVRLGGLRLAFVVGVPIAWAVLLLFHPAPDPNDIYGSLSGDATAMIVVHLGTLLFIGLTGVALSIIIAPLKGVAATVSRIGIWAFVLFYGAGEAILGIATGVLVRRANEIPPDERAGLADAAQALWDEFLTADLLAAIGTIGWVVAAIAAAVALRQAAASLAASILIGTSAITVFHGPPVGPLGLLLFAGGAFMLARGGAGSGSASMRADVGRAQS